MNTYIDSFNLVSAEASLVEKCATLRVEMILLASPEPEEINEASLFESFVSTFRTYDVTYLRTLLATLTESYNEMAEKHSKKEQTEQTTMKANTYAQKCILEMDNTVNPRYVEAFLREKYGTLNHLDDDDFKAGILFFKVANMETVPDEDNSEYWEYLCKVHCVR